MSDWTKKIPTNEEFDFIQRCKRKESLAVISKTKKFYAYMLAKKNLFKM